MINRLVECVPNFSEGRDLAVIEAIAEAVRSVDKVDLLDIDPGFDANRTVLTFAGSPEAVAEAAFLSVQKASELIDMTLHHGEHPRIGGCDVLPFVPVSGVSMEETVVIARDVSERIGRELKIPVYCYEKAAFYEERRNLANCRSGQYEGLRAKLADPLWKPDYGPSSFNPKNGATVVGARDYLIAFNINLDTGYVNIANKIAQEIRESEKIVKNEKGENIRVPDKLKNVKAIGWYIEEYKQAQISMNLTDINTTPLHVVFEEVSALANSYGIRVTGSELIGLIPLEQLVASGKYFRQENGLSEHEAVDAAIIGLGLDNLRPFNKKTKILEYALINSEKNRDR